MTIHVSAYKPINHIIIQEEKLMEEWSNSLTTALYGHIESYFSEIIDHYEGNEIFIIGEEIGVFEE